MSAILRSRYPLILASSSPRRQDFFCQLGLDFTVTCADIVEEVHVEELPQDLVQRLALAKAGAVAKDNPLAVVVGADTVVVEAGRILGKPVNIEEAVAMVSSLVGQWHEVWTGIAIIASARQVRVSEAVCTKVKFAQMDMDICQAYGASGDGLDKAGGYGIQSQGAFLVEEIIGSYSNVIGLPMAQLTQQLLRLGIVEAR